MSSLENQRIFDIYGSKTEGLYHFYDAHGQEIKRHNIYTLQEACSYTVEKKPKEPHFLSRYKKDFESVEWGIPLTIKTELDNGIKNTKMYSAVEFLYNTNLTSIWNIIKDLNKSYTDNYSDWYIPSEKEMIKLAQARELYSLEGPYFTSTVNRISSTSPLEITILHVMNNLAMGHETNIRAKGKLVPIRKF